MKNIKDFRTQLTELSETTDDAEMRKLTTLVRSGLFDAKKLTLLKRALNKDNLKMTKVERDTLLDLLDKLLTIITTNQGVFQKVKQSVNEELIAEDYEFSMARSQLKTIIRDAEALLDQIQGEGEMESWMQSKITLASDYIGAVADNVVSGESEIKKLKEEYEELTLEEAKTREDVDINQMPPIIILKRRAIRVYPGGQKVALYWADSIQKYVTVPFSSTSVAMNEETALNELAGASSSAARQAVLDRISQQYLQHQNLAGHHTGADDDAEAEIHARNADKALKKYKKLAGNKDASVRLRAMGKKVAKASEARRVNMGSGVAQDYVNLRGKINPIAAAAGALGVAMRRGATGTGPTALSNLRLRESVRNNFNSKLQVLREEQVNEDVWGAIDTGAEIAVPYYSAVKKAFKGDWAGAALDAGTDTALLALTPETLGGAWGGRMAGKVALKGAETLAAKTATGAVERTAARTAARDAAKAERAAARKAKSNKTLRRLSTAAALGGLGGLGGGGGGNSGSSGTNSGVYQPTRAPTGFTDKVKGVDPLSGMKRPGAGYWDTEVGARQAQKKLLGLQELKAPSKLFRLGKKGLTATTVATALGSMGSGSGSNNDKGVYQPGRAASGFADRVQGIAPTRTASGMGYYDTPVGARDSQKRMLGLKEDTLNQLKNIVESNVDTKELQIGEEYITINNGTAKKILHIYESVNKINKVKMDRMLNESVDSFTKLIEFANRR